MTTTIIKESKVLNLEYVLNEVKLTGEAKISSGGTIENLYGQVFLNDMYEGTFNRGVENVSVNVKTDENMVKATNAVMAMIADIKLM